MSKPKTGAPKSHGRRAQGPPAPGRAPADERCQRRGGDHRLWPAAYGNGLELPRPPDLRAALLGGAHDRLSERVFPVFLGAAAAFVIQSAVAVVAGSLLSLLPREPIRIGAGLLFLVMAALLIRRTLRKDEALGEQAVEPEQIRRRRPFVTAFSVVFVAEWGDLTQLATAALQARYQEPVLVFTAATLALWAVSAIAVVLGNRLGAWIPERPLQFAAAGVMVVVAIALISGLLG